MEPELGIIFFDGVCNLCNRAVQQIIKWDKNKVFKFTSLQSDFGQEFIKTHNLEDISSVILFQENEIYTKSDAILSILKTVDGWKSKLYYLRFIPKSIRDTIYDWVAKNRYRWFGQKEECWLPSQELKDRFI